MNQSIQTWRSSLEKTGHFSKEQLDELESHLRDEIDQLTTEVLTNEEKVLVAGNRLGSSSTLAKAYSKDRLFDFSRMSVFAQLLLGITTFFSLAQLCLYFAVQTHTATNFEDSSFLIFLYFAYQLIIAAGIFFLTRHWLKLSIGSGKTVSANLYALLTYVLSYGIHFVFVRLTDFGSALKGPTFISAFGSLVFLVFLLFFFFNTLRVWRKQNRLKIAA